MELLRKIEITRSFYLEQDDVIYVEVNLKRHSDDINMIIKFDVLKKSNRFAYLKPSIFGEIPMIMYKDSTLFDEIVDFIDYKLFHFLGKHKFVEDKDLNIF